MEFKNTKNIILALAATLVAACTAPPNSKGNSFAGNIIGGKEAGVEFQKENGVVMLVIIKERLSAEGTVVSSQSVCTGTLIAPKVVLSAAHCFASPFVTAVAVVLNNNIGTTTQADVIYTDEVKINEGYNPERINDENFVEGHPHGDLALLKLKKAVPAEFKAAPLPAAAAAALKKGDMLTLAGFGVDVAIQNKIEKDPQTGADTVVPLTTGNSGSGVLRVVEDVPVSQATADGKEIAVDETLGRNACHGDSGGPAYKKNANGKLVIVGVVSRGTNKIGNCDQTGVFTDVSGYLNWINSTAQALQATGT